MSRCPRCAGSGLVVHDQVVNNSRHGERLVAVAYRCHCAAGQAQSDKIALEPVEPDGWQERKDLA